MEKLYLDFKKIQKKIEDETEFKKTLWEYTKKECMHKTIVFTKIPKNFSKDLAFMKFILGADKIEKIIDWRINEKYLRKFEDITFSNCKFKHFFVIRNLTFNGELKFFNCEFESNFKIENSEINGKSEFLYSKFKGDYELINITSQKINLTNCYFIGRCSYFNCSIEGKLQIKRSGFIKILEIKDTYFSDIKFTNDSKYHNNHDSNINKIKLSFSEAYSKKQCGRIKISRVQDLKNLQIGGDGRDDVMIDEVIMDRVYMYDFKGLFLFYSININKLSYSNSTNLPEYIVFSDIKIKKQLKFDNLNFKELLFNSFTIKSLFFKNTNFNQCKFNGVIFPINYKLIDIKTSNDLVDFKKMRDNYRQLKHVMDKNGNYIEANIFYGLEMKYFVKTLKLYKLDFWLYKCQYYISDFGNNWFQPLLLIFAISNIRLIAITKLYADSYQLPEGYLTNIINGITPFMTYIKTDELTVKSFIYNTTLVFLIYHFTISLKRTTKR